MSVGKYSPTVSHSYSMDQGWWEKNGGGYGNGANPESDLDDDGYDSYGYHCYCGEDGLYHEGVDRAGYTEMDYLTSYVDSDEDDSVYHHVHYDWARRSAAGYKGEI